MPRLIIESGTDKGMIYPLTQQIVSLGRSPLSDIQILDRKVSRYHAEIYRENDVFNLRDLHSKNGTYLNGEEVLSEAKLKNGDTARIGDTVFLFEIETARQGMSELNAVELEDVDWGTTREVQSAGIKSPGRLPLAASDGDVLHDNQIRLEILYHVTDIIRSILDIDELLRQVLTIIFNLLQPDRGCILLTKEKDRLDSIFPRLIKQADETSEGPFTVSKSVLERCFKERISILVSDAEVDSRFKSSESIVAERIKSAICAPLIYKDEILGAIYIDARNRIRSYQKEELDIFTSIANQAAMAIANASLHQRLVERERFEKEMEIARSIQHNLLPRHSPEIEGFQFSAISIPAKRVGGDFYDVINLPNHKWGVGMADVSGKGVPAAILAASLRTALQISAPHFSDSPPDLIARLNRLVCKDTSDEMFITLFYCVVDEMLKSITFVNAGHRHPILVHPNGQISALAAGGPFLGVSLHAEYKYDTIKLDLGSALVVFSDGLIDAHNPQDETYGEQRLRDVVTENLSLPADDLLQAILRNLEEFKAGAAQFDDLTIAVIKAV